MNEPFLLTWLAGTLLPLSALWLVYRVALRGERCFGYNRALLLLAPVVAALWPLLPRPVLPLWLVAPTAAAPETGAAVLLPAWHAGQAAAPVAGWSAGAWLGLLYLAGVALGLGRLAWQAARLRGLARRLPREVRPGYVLAYTGGRLPTSSFGRVIFWDETAALAPLEAAVLAHEVAHVGQRHTLDRLWLEAWRAVLWPNPFAHLLLPGLRLTHELLADRAAASPDAAATPYPTLLARLAARQLEGPAYSALLQPFTFSFTLTRIAMLQNQIPVRRWKQWLVLPVLGGLFLAACQSADKQPVPSHTVPPAITVNEAQQKSDIEKLERKVREAEHQDSLRTGGKFEPGTVQQVAITNMNGPGEPSEPIVTVTRVKAPSPPPAPELTSSGHVIYTYVEQMPQLPGGGDMQAIIEAIKNKIVYPATTVDVPASGRVFARFVVDTDGTVHDATIVKGLTSAFDEAVLAAVRQLPRFAPGQQNGKAVAVSFTVPVKFAP